MPLNAVPSLTPQRPPSSQNNAILVKKGHWALAAALAGRTAHFSGAGIRWATVDWGGGKGWGSEKESHRTPGLLHIPLGGMQVGGILPCLQCLRGLC